MGKLVVRLVGPKTMVRIRKGFSAIPRDIRLIHGIAAKDVVHARRDGIQILSPIGEIGSQSEDKQVVEQKRVGAPGRSIFLAPGDGYAEASLLEHRDERVSRSDHGGACGLLIRRWQRPRNHSQRECAKRRHVLPSHARRNPIAFASAEVRGDLQVVRRRDQELVVRRSLRGDEKLGRCPVEFIINVLVVVGPASHSAWIGKNPRILGRGSPSLLGCGYTARRKFGIDGLPNSAGLRRHRGQIQRRRGRHRIEKARHRIFVRRQAERGPRLVVNLVMNHAGLGLAVGHLHLKQELQLPTRLVQ